MRRSPSTAPRERPPRSFWFDPRFAVGLVLVAASIIGVVALVSSSDRTVEVWAARDVVTPGDVLTQDDLMLRPVGLGELAGEYLAEAALPDDGLVATRTIDAGELVPASAVGDRQGETMAPVVVQSRGDLPQQVVPGAVVDVWSSPEADDGSFGAPAVLVGSATVVRVLETDGLIVDGATTGVELLVPRGRTAAVLAASAGGDAMSLVPVSIPVPH